MQAPILIALGVLGIVLLAGSSFGGEANLVAGKRYQFFWKAKPALGLFKSEAVRAALRASGAESITLSDGQGESVGSHIMTAQQTKVLKLNEPLLAIDGIELVMTGVKEVS